MHVISRKALVDFWGVHARARAPLSAWYRIVSEAVFKDFASVRRTFNSADLVARDFVVFNANSYRVVTAIHYNRGKVYVRHVFTHADYERWSTRMKKGLS
jgi:mRNA interferase HigB